MPAPTGVGDGSHYPYDAPPDPPEQEPPAGLQEEAEERHSWRPVDLGPILDGTWKAPEPTVGKRSDGKGLFYPGKSHTVIGETESAKTWLALSAALDEMGEGKHVLYLDFEDDEGTIVNRLLMISAHSAEMIRERFHYLRPDSDLRSRVNAADLGEVLHAYQPTLAVIDGITEAMFIHGLDPLDNVDIAHFNAILTKSLTVLGAAAVALDHVKKNGDSRDRYALGGVHKLNAVSGAGSCWTTGNRSGSGSQAGQPSRSPKTGPGSYVSTACGPAAACIGTATWCSNRTTATSPRCRWSRRTNATNRSAPLC
jgi:hypothetical protein